MAKIDSSITDFSRFDTLAAGRTPLHRLDPRAKVATTAVYILTVLSFGKYEFSGLLPFLFFPAILLALGGLPARFVARKVLVVLPFVFFVGIFNPLFDRTIMFHIGTVGVSGGWISFASIMLRSFLTIGTVLTVIAATPFSDICTALERMGMPQVFVVQLYFLYRYIFVLGEEGGRAARAREMRSFGRSGMGIRSYAPLVGHLLLRTWERAERIHRAMLCRGFNGTFSVRGRYRFGMRETLFVAGWVVFFILCRRYDVAEAAGRFITGYFQ